MTREVLGGNEQFTSVHDELYAFYLNAAKSQLNKICFCQQPLGKRQLASTGGRCASCLRKYSVLDVYICSNDQCLYKKVVESQWIICPSCYNARTEIVDIESEIQHNKARTLISSKLVVTLNYIGVLDFCHSTDALRITTGYTMC